MSDDGNLRALFRTHLRGKCDMQAVETGLIAAGVPDLNYCVQGGFEGWVEMKQTDGYAVTLRPEQVGWISRRCRAGGRVLIAVRRWHDGGPRKGPPVDELWLLKGAYAPDLKTMGLQWAHTDNALLGQWSGGPARWDWSAVLRHMRK
jgi:hypothetical protein